MHCGNCGSEVSDGTQFCPQCGNYIQPNAAAVGGSGEYIATAAATEPSMSKAEFKAAKNAYKEARKAAGKSRKPLVIGIIIAVLVVAGLAAGGTWFFMSQQQPNKTAGIAETATETETPSADTSSATEAATEEADPYAAYVGKWEGVPTSIDGSGARCHGASGQKMELDITSISQFGLLEASGKVFYHGHDSVSSNDVPSTNGDKYVSFENLTCNFDSEQFTLKYEVDHDKHNSIEMVFTPEQTAGKIELKVVVKSVYDWSTTGEETYILTKVN